MQRVLVNNIKIYSFISSVVVLTAPWVAGYFAFATAEYLTAFVSYLAVTGMFLLADFLLRHELAKLDGKDKPRRLFKNRKADSSHDV